MAVVGSLLFSRIITLYMTPVIYTYPDAWQQRMARKKVKEPAYTEPRAGEPRAAGAAG